jgi:hypothetical protein
MAISSAADPAETWTHARSALVLAMQKYGKDSPQAVAARANFKARRLGHHIEQTLASAPPLTLEQRAKLAELLRPARQARRAEAEPGGAV